MNRNSDFKSLVGRDRWARRPVSLPSISHLPSPISNLQSPISTLPSSISSVPAVNYPAISNLQSPISNLQSSVCPPSRLLSIIGILFAITVAAVEVLAQSQPFTPRLSLDVATRYTDNLLIDPTTKIKDFTEVISPEVGFLYGQSHRTYIGVDYKAEIERYFTYEKYDANNQYVTLDTQAQFDHGTVRLQQAFQDVTSPSYEVSGFSREQLPRTDVNGEYRLNSKTSAGLDYHQEFHDWLTAGRIGYRQFDVGGTFYYHLFPKTDLLGQFNQGWVQMDHGANAIYEELNIGFRGQLTSKITGTATIGYQHREFDSSSVPDWNEPVASIRLQAQLTERITAALTASRTINPSSTYPDRSYVVNNLDLNVNYRLFRAVRLTVGGGYLGARMSAANIVENYMREELTARVGMSYDLTKWVQIRTRYECTGRDYTITGNAMENAAILHVNIHY